jgi:hypothetical protein
MWSGSGHPGRDDFPDGHQGSQIVGRVVRDVSAKDRHRDRGARGLRIEQELGPTASYGDHLREDHVAYRVRSEGVAAWAETLRNVDSVALAIVRTFDPLARAHDSIDGHILDR